MSLLWRPSGGELLPRLLYRVKADGSRQLVRGAVFDELDSRSLRSGIVAAGNDSYVSNSLEPTFRRRSSRRACSSTTSGSNALPSNNRSYRTIRLRR